METSENQRFIYEFGKFVLDPQEKTLFADGKPVRLPAKEFETLLLLVENNGKALSKEEMLQAVWQDTFVEENNLAKYISRLRKIFDTKGQTYIETLPKHGYRFSAEINQIAQAADETILEKRTIKRLTVRVEEEKPLMLPAEKGKIPNKSIFAAAVLVVLLSALGFWAWTRTNAPSKINSIAVLPLKSLTAEENNKALGLGLADALITKIGSLRAIAVRPTSAVAKYAEIEVDALEIGRKLNVDAVLEGTIQQSEGRIRINTRLLRVENGEQIWAEKFDGEQAKIFDLEDRLSKQAARALSLKLNIQESERLTRHNTSNNEAFDAYLKGRYFWNKRTEEGFKKAIVFFNQAIEKDADYAQAYSGLADCYILLGIWGALPPVEAMPKAKEAVIKSLKADDTLADAHISLAFIKWVYDWDWAGADEEFQKALELDPNNATAHHWYAYYLAAIGRFDEAIVHINKAQELEGSLSFSIGNDIGEIYCWSGQHDRAISQLEEIARLQPDFAIAHNTLGIAYLKKGRIVEAVAELETARRLDNSPRMLSTLGYAYGAAGQRDKARKIIGELKELSAQRYVSAFATAIVYAGLGEDQETLDWLEKAYHERSDTMAIFNVYPLLDNVRTKPQFVKFQQRAGLIPR